MELVEHVPDPASLVTACARLVKPGGDLVFATVNRTPLAYLLVILAAEYLMGIVRMVDLSGLRYIPLIGYARLCTSVQMNYLIHFKKPAGTSDRKEE